MDVTASGITLYSTCRSSIGYRAQSHLDKLVETARWAEDAGFRGALLYSDNTSIDAWTSAHAAIANTDTFVPLIAVQPLDMSPFACARVISSLAHLYGRRIDINFVSGGFSRDLAVQADGVSHDARYDRLTEYVTVIKQLLDGGVVNHSGQFFNYRRARLTAGVPVELQPRAYLSGSSEVSVQTGEALRLPQLSFPIPPEEFASPEVRKNKYGTGIGIGIIAREDSAEAWRIARKRFPADPDGAERMKLLLPTSVSSWQTQLAAVPTDDDGEDEVYWLGPFRYHHTVTPYLVGNYDDVARAVRTYLDGGVRTFVLDLPQEPDDLHHARTAIERGIAAMAK